jgi:hypothetical protein
MEVSRNHDVSMGEGIQRGGGRSGDGCGRRGGGWRGRGGRSRGISLPGEGVRRTFINASWTLTEESLNETKRWGKKEGLTVGLRSTQFAVGNRDIPLRAR